jgi:hypothetical protein
LPPVRSELRLKVGVAKRLTFLLVLPPISCHQFSAGQVLGVEDVVVVVVPEELEVLDDSSSFLQEITVRLKQKIIKMSKTFFIFSSI